MNEEDRTTRLIVGLFLLMAFVLIDSNIPPTSIDLEFIDHLGALNVPFALIFTKTDRQKKGDLERNIEDFLQEMLKSWEALPPYFITSANYRTGRTELLEYIEEVIKSLPG